MRATAVVVIDDRRENGFELPPVEDLHPVETLRLDRDRVTPVPMSVGTRPDHGIA
jgi:hypothetical protein